MKNSRNAGPPRLADRLLEFFCAPHLLEEVQGDLHERYVRDVTRMGIAKAKRTYTYNVLSFLRPFALKRRSSEYPPIPLFSVDMLRNYIKIAWRNLANNKAFSFINIVGLSLGMVCSLIIYLWVQDERKYDKFHANGDRLYRVIVNSIEKTGEISNSFENSPGVLSGILKKEIPEISHAATITWENKDRMRVGTKATNEKGRIVGADFFEMFSFPLLKGNPRTIFAAPNSLVISQRLANKYFGFADPIGKLIRLNEKDDYVVSGVFATVPANSSIKFDYVRSFESFAKNNPWIVDGWSDFGPSTVVMLRSDASLEKVNAKIRRFLTQHDKTVTDKTLSLQPYRDQYLYSRFENGIPVGGRIEYVRLFSVVALFVLLIACINFVNLATARSVKRAKEIGIRKVVGAAKAYLVGQFMGESLLMTLIAASLSILLSFLLLPTFNSITGKTIEIPLDTPAFVGKLTILVTITTLLSGIYPALFLSSFNPVNVLKGSFSTKPGIATFRKGLVVFQFTLSLALIIGALVVYQQMNYIQTKNIGLSRENVLYIKLEGELGKKYESFKQTVLQSNTIEHITTINTIPTDVGNATSDLIWTTKKPTDKFSIWLMGASYDFAKTLNIKLKEGRSFSPAFRTDTAGFLLNEVAAERMHLKNPIGQPIDLWGKKGTVIGLMKNFHMQSLHRTIEPLIVYFEPQPRGNIVARIQAGKTQQALLILQKAHKEINPAYPFSYEFADDAFRQQYKSETIIRELATCFAVLAILISCLGLFGLAAFTAEQRTKEIGVRKVLGASVSSIITLLSTDFLKLVLLAIVIASPIAWWIMDKWLQDFAYKTELSWWIFALSGLLAVGIALLTVSFQSVKAALTNPVKSLRSE
ncbi:ABC transporter permease [Spirosoma endophyticum]|uniref:MacB-like core domain-containing protein n=1 Tax=Spirosoma endophyticum TaxID=662367 RepID=A0A1I1GGI4_9BACT|nr:ABC transporter permease [Spirosoma endophyticum]SFC10352.1 MacB-like core domain-containing protein [Spirosoma endophyticum]